MRAGGKSSGRSIAGAADDAIEGVVKASPIEEAAEIAESVAVKAGDDVIEAVSHKVATSLSTPEGLTNSAANSGLESFEEIAKFRRKAGLPKYDPSLTKAGSQTGTVAYVPVGGKNHFGVNSGFSKASRALRKETFGRIQKELGMYLNTTYNKVLSLLHAEAHALMRASRYLQRAGKEFPEEVTLFVDRALCPSCRRTQALPKLAELFKIKRLIVKSSDGKKWLVRPGHSVIPID